MIARHLHLAEVERRVESANLVRPSDRVVEEIVPAAVPLRGEAQVLRGDVLEDGHEALAAGGADVPDQRLPRLEIEAQAPRAGLARPHHLEQRAMLRHPDAAPGAVLRRVDPDARGSDARRCRCPAGRRAGRTAPWRVV